MCQKDELLPGLSGFSLFLPSRSTSLSFQIGNDESEEQSGSEGKARARNRAGARKGKSEKQSGREESESEEQSGSEGKRERGTERE